MDEKDQKKSKIDTKYYYLGTAVAVIIIGIILIIVGKNYGWFGSAVVTQKQIPATNIYQPIAYDGQPVQTINYQTNDQGQTYISGPIYDQNGAPVTTWNTYINGDLNFTFSYPASWSPKRIVFKTEYEIYFENNEFNFMVDRNRINPPSLQNLLDSVSSQAGNNEGYMQDTTYVGGFPAVRVTYISPRDGGRVIILYVPHGNDIVQIEYHHKKHSQAIFDAMVSSFRFLR